jgi:F-type H+-transporting ATPase subunit gamma
MDSSEGASTRLETVRAVEPLVNAMRNISMGSWQRAQDRRTEVQAYRQRLTTLHQLLLPHLPRWRAASPAAERRSDRIVLVLVGSERGLVGQFNRQLVQRLSRIHAEQASAGLRPETWALGARLTRILAQESHDVAWSHPLPGASLPSYDMALRVIRELLADYGADDLLRADVLFQRQASGGAYDPILLRLIPPDIGLDGAIPSADPWPPPIIDSDPLGLYARLAEQISATTLYECLIDSAVSEHAARFHLMEEASQNAARLIEELNWSIQAARREAITREMQDLAVGAGLLDST